MVVGLLDRFFMKSLTETRKQVSLKERKIALEAKIADLTGTFRDRSGLTIENSPDTLDTVCMSTDRDVLVQRMNTVARMLGEVRKAVIKCDTGDYGVCEECEEPIGQGRLDAIPWAALCVNCQETCDLQGSETFDGVSVAA